MQQMMAEMRTKQEMMNASLKEMDVNQATVDDTLRKMKEKIRSSQAEMKSTVSAIKEKTKA
jgi:chromosome segregation ATPase